MHKRPTEEKEMKQYHLDMPGVQAPYIWVKDPSQRLRTINPSHMGEIFHLHGLLLGNRLGSWPRASLHSLAQLER